MSESILILITPIPNGEPTYRLKRKRKIMTDTKDLSSTDLLQYIRRNSYIEEHVIDDFEVVTKSIEKAKTHLASAMKCPTNAGKLVECNRALMAMPPSEHFGSPGTASATLFASVLALRGEALASLRYHAAATKSFREALKHTPEENHIKRFKLIRDLLRIGEASDTETTEVLRSEARSMLEKAGFSDIQIGNQMNSLSADRGKEQDEKIPMLEVDSPPHEYLSDAVMFTRNDKVLIFKQLKMLLFHVELAACS